MANTSLSLIQLDPDTYKENLKTYLKTQSIFKDYNYEDSNINVLLDILAKNTYQNTFYKNMVYAESQLDSALLRDSVVSQAKSLNYTPQSRRSASANVDITYTATGITTLQLPKGTHFSGRNGVTTYTFTTDKAYIAKSSTGVFNFNNIKVYEGSYFSDTYIMDYSVENQEFIVSNENVDITSLSVLVIEENGSVQTEFTRVTSLFDLTPLDTIYFVEGYSDSKYKIVFGNNVFGRNPADNSTIILLYRVASGGPDANDVTTISIDEDIAAQAGGVTTSFSTKTLTRSSGGAEKESIDSIKYNAPRHYATQESAVTPTDYKSIIENNFYNLIDSVEVYGGETANPKKYGRTIIALKPVGGDTTPDYVKSVILQTIRSYNVGSVRPILVDADSLYLKINSTVQYNSVETQLFFTDVEKSITDVITNYSKNNLEKFSKDFRYSNFVSSIDKADNSITSNDTTVSIVKRLFPVINRVQQFNISFGNVLKVEKNIISSGITNDPTLTSSFFDYLAPDGTITKYAYFIDDNKGNLNVCYNTETGSTIVLNNSAGTINYDTGEVLIKNVLFSAYGEHLDIIVVPRTKDVFARNNTILYIDINDCNISLIEELN